MQTTEETVSNRVLEATSRRSDLENIDLQQKLQERDDTIHLLQLRATEMEALRRNVVEKQELLASLGAMNVIEELLRRKCRELEDIIDRLNYEKVDNSLLKTQLQQKTMKLQNNDVTIGLLKRNNQEKDNEIAQLKLKLADYHALANNFQKCSCCRCAEIFSCKHHDVVRELELTRREYNQLKVDNKELNEQLISRVEVNAQLQYRLANLEKDKANTCLLLKTISKMESKTDRKRAKRQVEDEPNEPVLLKKMHLESKIENKSASDSAADLKNKLPREMSIPEIHARNEAVHSQSKLRNENTKSTADESNFGRSLEIKNTKNGRSASSRLASDSKQMLPPRVQSTPASPIQARNESVRRQSERLRSKPKEMPDLKKILNDRLYTLSNSTSKIQIKRPPADLRSPASCSDMQIETVEKCDGDDSNRTDGMNENNSEITDSTFQSDVDDVIIVENKVATHFADKDASPRVKTEKANANSDENESYDEPADNSSDDESEESDDTVVSSCRSWDDTDDMIRCAGPFIKPLSMYTCRQADSVNVSL